MPTIDAFEPGGVVAEIAQCCHQETCSHRSIIIGEWGSQYLDEPNTIPEVVHVNAKINNCIDGQVMQLREFGRTKGPVFLMLLDNKPIPSGNTRGTERRKLE